jgi:hypothetical protein
MVTGAQSHMVDDAQVGGSVHSSPEEQNPGQAQVQSNDSSDLSVNSEKDVEIVVINTKGATNQVENKGRKRKRLEFKQPDTPRPEQKHGKITDYINRVSPILSGFGNFQNC